MPWHTQKEQVRSLLMQHLVLLSSDFRQLGSYKVRIMIESASMLQGVPFSRTALDWLISLMWAISPEKKTETNKQKKTEGRGMITENSVQHIGRIFLQLKLALFCISLLNLRGQTWGCFTHECFNRWGLQHQQTVCMCESTIRVTVPQTGVL